MTRHWTSRYLLFAATLWTGGVLSATWGQQTADGCFNLAQAAQSRGDRSEGVRLFQRASELYAQMEARAAGEHHSLPAATLRRYAYSLAAVGKMDDAVREMREASEAEPNNAMLHNDLGTLFAQQSVGLRPSVSSQRA